MQETTEATDETTMTRIPISVSISLVGASYDFSGALDLVGQYRYLNTSGFVDEVHALEVGLRYNF